MPISVTEYLNTSYRPDRDYVDGEVRERNLGEYEHSRPQARIIMFFGARENEGRIRVVPEQRVQVKPTRFRIPDICVALESTPVEPIFRHSPFICIEILSKWVVQPHTRRGYRYTSEGFLEAKDGILRTTNPELAMPLEGLFE